MAMGPKRKGSSLKGVLMRQKRSEGSDCSGMEPLASKVVYRAWRGNFIHFTEFDRMRFRSLAVVACEQHSAGSSSETSFWASHTARTLDRLRGGAGDMIGGAARST
jgi:hypothetical protein